MDHVSLRGDNRHFQDDVHINQGSGTRALVADITGAARRRNSNREGATNQSSGENRRGHAAHRGGDSRAFSQRREVPPTQENAYQERYTGPPPP